ncbi:nucleotide exchange factor GrpE, partial [Mycoplasma elephantis]|uniref:nucleotide exchange factor GrpE n=1 Tax=Mycoplasma elephantis TaxID=114882 RepID=UPI000487E121
FEKTKDSLENSSELISKFKTENSELIKKEKENQKNFEKQSKETKLIFKREIDTLRKENSDLIKQNQTINTQWATEKQEIIDKTNKKIFELETNNNDLSTKNKELSKVHEKEIKTLTDNNKKELASLKKDIQNLEKSNQKISKELNNEREVIANKTNNIISKLEKEKESLINKEVAQKNEYEKRILELTENSKKEILSLKNNQISLEKSISKLQQDGDKYKKIAQETQEKYLKEKKIAGALSVEKVKFNVQELESKRKIEEIESKNTELINKVKTLTSDLNLIKVKNTATEHELEKVKVDNTQLVKDLRKTQTDFNIVSSENKTLKDARQTSMNIEKEFSGNNNEKQLKSRIKDLLIDVQILRKNDSNLRREYEISENENNELKSVNIKLENELRNTKNNLDNLTKQNNELTINSKNKIDILNKKYKKDIDDANNQINLHKEQIAKLEYKLEENESKLESLNEEISDINIEKQSLEKLNEELTIQFENLKTSSKNQLEKQTNDLNNKINEALQVQVKLDNELTLSKKQLIEERNVNLNLSQENTNLKIDISKYEAEINNLNNVIKNDLEKKIENLSDINDKLNIENTNIKLNFQNLNNQIEDNIVLINKIKAENTELVKDKLQLKSDMNVVRDELNETLDELNSYKSQTIQPNQENNDTPNDFVNTDMEKQFQNLKAKATENNELIKELQEKNEELFKSNSIFETQNESYRNEINNTKKQVADLQVQLNSSIQNPVNQGANANSEATINALNMQIQELNQQLIQKDQQIVEKARELQDKNDEEFRKIRQTQEELLSSEMANVKKFGNQSFFEKMLPLFINFNLALQSGLNHENGVVKNFAKGFDMVKNQMIDGFKHGGVKEIDVKVGDDFDPETSMVVEIEQGKNENKITKVITPGYMLHDRVIIPAKVAISKKK